MIKYAARLTSIIRERSIIDVSALASFTTSVRLRYVELEVKSADVQTARTTYAII